MRFVASSGLLPVRSPLLDEGGGSGSRVRSVSGEVSADVSPPASGLPHRMQWPVPVVVSSAPQYGQAMHRAGLCPGPCEKATGSRLIPAYLLRNHRGTPVARTYELSVQDWERCAIKDSPLSVNDGALHSR